MPKKSNFITDSEVPNGHYFDTFGNGVNRKISKANLFAQIKSESLQTYYYDSEDDLKAADLEADPDNPIYVRVAPAWRLYRITSLAPVAPFDIALDNGATATLDRLENLRAATVGDMKNIPFLKEGDFVDTINFSAAQDKGGNTYEIGTFGTADGVFIIDLTATALQARRMNPVALEADNLQEVKDAPFLYIGDTATYSGYTTSTDGGGNKVEIVAAGTGTDDGGSFIDLPGSGLQARGLFLKGIVNAKQFGFTDLSGTFAEYKGFPRAIEYAIKNDLEISGLDLKLRRYIIRDDKRIYDQDDQPFTIKGVSLFDFLLVSFETRTTYNIRPGLSPTESKATGFSRIQWINPANVELMIQKVVDDGCNTIRVGVDPANENAPEQAAADGLLYPSEMQMLDTVIYYATKYNLVVHLRQGRKDATASQFSDFMSFLIQRYSRFQNVWYNPENEINGGITNDVPTWVSDIETYLTAMRAAGCTTPIIIQPTQFGGEVGLVDVLPSMDSSTIISTDPALVIGFHVYQQASEDEGFVKEARQSAQEDAIYRAYSRYAIFIDEIGISNQLTGGIDPVLDNTDPDDPQSALIKSNQLQEWMREYMRWLVREVQAGYLLGCTATTYGAYIPGSDKHDVNSLRVFGKAGEPNDDFKLTKWGTIYLDRFLKTDQSTTDAKGQVRLEVIGGSVTLNRVDGANLVVNHRVEQLQNSGKTISSSGVPQDVISWVYAQLDSDNLIELVATQIAPEFDPISGVFVEPVASVITGASSNRYDELPRTLVGMVYKVAAGFVSTDSRRLVRSWFNRKPLGLSAALSANDAKVAVIEDISALKLDILLWHDEIIDVNTGCQFSTNALLNVHYKIEDNGAGEFPEYLKTATSGNNEFAHVSIQVGDGSDSFHEVQVIGGASSSTTTFKSGGRIYSIIPAV